MRIGEAAKAIAEHREFTIGSTDPYMRNGDPKTSGVGFGLQMHESRLDQPLRWKRPRRIFVNSMSDLFHPEVTDEFLLAVWATFEAAPQHTYQVLTKRPERMRAFLTRHDEAPRPDRAAPIAETMPVPGFPGYTASVAGVITGPRGVLSPDTNKETGHQRVTLYIDGERHRRLVHHVVLDAFGEPRPSTDAEARHLNGDASDNSLGNLLWGSQEHNWADRIEHGNEQSYTKVGWLEVFLMRRAVLAGATVTSMASRFDISDTQVRNIVTGRQWAPRPRPWIWLGTSVENARWRTRIDELRATPAAVRFLSCEPLLGSLTDWTKVPVEPRELGRVFFDLTGIDWVIIGGESGPGARPMDPDWVRDIVAACRRQGASPFVKQLGSAWSLEHLGHKGHAGNPDEWPEDLRVREFPL
jgi:protein gp37